MICWQTIARRTSHFTAVLVLLCVISGLVVAAEPQPLVLRGGAVFDPVAGSFQPDRTIVIDGAHIRSVSGPNADLPHGARTVDCRGKYLIPGLIDAHVHLVHLANLSHVAGDQFLPMFLARGVTSVRDAGDAIVAQSVIARSAELRPELCPRVFLTSPLIDTEPPLHRDIGYALTVPVKESQRSSIPHLHKHEYPFRTCRRILVLEWQFRGVTGITGTFWSLPPR
ncbi:MAG: hypothetical protein ACC628_14530 [Pirellulaceae bacterium]